VLQKGSKWVLLLNMKLKPPPTWTSESKQKQKKYLTKFVKHPNVSESILVSRAWDSRDMRVCRRRDDKYRVLASLQAGQRNFRVPVQARIQLLSVFVIGKRLDLFYNSGCLLALKIKKIK